MGQQLPLSNPRPDSSNRYVRLLGAMYMRLTGTAVDCYKYLEPLYNDYRKVKTQKRDGGEFL